MSAVRVRGDTAIDGLTALTGPPSARRIVLGGRFGEEPEPDSARRLQAFAATGGCFVDTAHSYADGRSEQVIGRWLCQHPGRLQIVSKIGHPDASGVLNLSHQKLVAETRRSAARLGVPALDVVLLHRDDPSRAVPDLVASLVTLVRDGLARSVGVSNWTAPRLAEAVEVLRRHHISNPVVSYQFSLAVPHQALWPGAQHADAAILDVVRRFQLPLLGWAGQARGYFTGHTDWAPAESDPFDTPANAARRERCRRAAAEFGTTPESVALAWSLQQPGIWPIIGPRSLSELRTSMAAAQLDLPGELAAWLSEPQE